MSPTITITTGCYNSEKFIERTYASIAAQDYSNIEWVVVNDASKDNTLAVLNNIAAKAPFPVTIINFENNNGTVYSNATAIQKAAGDFIILLDHDDELMPGSLGRLIKLWDEYAQGDLFGIWGSCVNEKNELLGEPIPGLPMVCSYGYFFHVLKCRVEKLCMFRADILKKYFHVTAKAEGATNGIIWNRMGQDYKAIFTNEVIRKYYMDVPGSMTKQTKKKYPSLMANQEAEYLITNNSFFYKDFLFFLKKILIYQAYCYHAGINLFKGINNLKRINLKVAAFLMLPLLPLALLRDRLK